MVDLFRKKSLERLSNSNQLDYAIVVTSTMSWMVVLAFLLMILAIIIWSFVGTIPSVYQTSGIYVSKTNVSAIYADKSGSVEKLKVHSGDVFEPGEVVATLKLDDGNIHEIKATSKGVAQQLLVDKQDEIYIGGELLRYTPDVTSNEVIVCYVPLMEAQQLKENMKVQVFLNVESKKHYLEASILEIGEYAVDVNHLSYVVGNNNLIADRFIHQGPIVSLICTLQDNCDAQNIKLGSLLDIRIITEELKPIQKLFPKPNH